MKLTIDKKVCLVISLMIFVFGIVIGIYAIRDETAHMNSVLNDKASVLLENLVYNLEYPALVRDTGAISRLVKGVLAQKEIVSCRVVASDGSVLYQERKKGSGNVREFSAPVIAKKTEEAEALIFGAPEEAKEAVGTVTLAVSLLEFNDKISTLRSTTVAVVLVVVLMVSIGTYFLLRRLVGKPVEQLVHATENIARGDLMHKVSLTTKDEFEILGDSFNRMTASLRTAQEEIVRRERTALLAQLAESVGNELRNPLGVMNNSVFLLKSHQLGEDETTREYLDIIKNEIENSQRILTDFIDFFKTRTPQVKKVSAHELIMESLEGCAIPDGLDLAVDVPETLPLLKVDPAQMIRVFQNLINNAVQAMSKGGELRINARHVEGGFVEISVADTGEGISPENMKKLFQPLFTTKSRGIGLGLPICRNYTEANGGRIEAESKPRTGSIFKVILPVGDQKME